MKESFRFVLPLALYGPDQDPIFICCEGVLIKYHFHNTKSIFEQFANFWLIWIWIQLSLNLPLAP